MRSNSSHGVFLANCLGMDIILTEEKLTYKVIGGILDFYIFLGPTPEDVAKQYQSIIGYPILPPYWSLGFHQSRWGYESVNELQDVIDNFNINELPLDTIWSDIDYMNEYRLWTLDPINYKSSNMKSFLKELHDNNRQYVMIIDPGVKRDFLYSAYNDGIEENIFIKKNNYTNDPVIGKVWPGLVSFIDFYNPNSNEFWKNHFKSFYNDNVKFNGIWIDMNEIANFCDGHCNLLEEEESNDNFISNITSQFTCLCSNPEYYELDFPPYQPGGIYPDSGTISMSSIHYNNIEEYYLHNLYGYLESKSTKETLIEILNERPFVLSRSTFSGSGHHTAHWLGDNTATWKDMKDSISGIINMNLFGITMVGADVCGFNGDTTTELCTRWMQLGAFYPFYRNHNGIGYISQEPYVFGKSVTDICRKALTTRYSLISFYYSKLIDIITRYSHYKLSKKNHNWL